MTDTTVATASPAKGAAKAKAAKPKRAKASNTHPKYVDMTVEAINSLKERNGSSRQAILKYITGHYNLGKDAKGVNTHLKLALKRGVATGVLKHAKGQGASGSFRVSTDKKGGPVIPAAVKPIKSPSKAKKVKAVAAEKASKKTAKTPEKKKKVAAAVAVVAKPKKEKKAAKTPSKKSSPEKKKKAAKKVKSPSKKASSLTLPDKKKRGSARGKGSSDKKVAKSPKKSARK